MSNEALDCSPPSSVAELLKRYAAGERYFVGASLESADLRHASLQGANLTNANLCRADLSQSNLRGANSRPRQHARELTVLRLFDFIADVECRPVQLPTLLR